MATRQSIDNMVQKTNETIAKAKEELDITNRNGFDINESYSNAQLRLSEVDQEILHLMNSASPQQREQLHRLHLQTSQCLNDMILDEEDLVYSEQA